MYGLCKGNPGEGFFSGTEKHIFGMGASLSYRGSVRGTWRWGSHSEDAEGHVLEGSGNGAFLLEGLHTKGF
jgi:hypothetical protein